MADGDRIVLFFLQRQFHKCQKVFRFSRIPHLIQLPTMQGIVVFECGSRSDHEVVRHSFPSRLSLPLSHSP